jgi:putative ABC transport system permease protein
MQKVFAYFASISIIIACLGLFALLSYSIESRNKEIAVRKVLGASISNLSWLIAKDFAILLLIAFAIATPVNYLLLQNWQGNFAYSAPFDIWSYLISFIVACILCFLAVFYHSIRLNQADPVHALRDE